MAATAAYTLISMLNSEPHKITFEQSMEAIEEMCEFTAVKFSVGDVQSEAGQNMGSAKVLSFGKLLGLDEETTLELFGSYYRVDVMDDPDGTSHPNIRAFMEGGWDNVQFPDGLALQKK